MGTSKFIMSAIALACGALATPTTFAAGADAKELISVVPSELKWKDAPSIGPGAQLAVLEGDLKKAEPITFRLKLPPNTTIAPHTHPGFERVTVLSGQFHLGIGKTVDQSKAKAYPAGGAVMIPAGMPMFAFTEGEETVVQVHGTGPWGVDYLDPATNPAKK
ncbi:MAG: cupin domain-containing protein [Aromatoleum sp.]|jgi:quercetin dioxygenase-like cupin family protein|uniref:cupin domain-containing protein n=1 Tax=Aromatoleum sp. TaxID=2307007 RepID=UPI00289490AD|nr:cupin domain-containing protein [Aromatoleum sp.]MDT3672709.1 cupin domain-containing protein [Aromatoleum sp.]